MAVDWLTIKNDYINGGGSYRRLAEKYGVSASFLMQKAAKEKWNAEKQEHQSRTEAETKQKTQEKISDALSDEAALKIKLRVGLLKMAVDWVEDHEKIKDTGDFRRIVQSCIDLGAMDVQSGVENEDDGLLNALDKIAGNVFEDGDDSGMLPKEKDE